jgi:UDP-N-acetylmuramoyl-L-alanyl-D-glutamate--2,6-diaminopimelate ligase
MKINGIEITGLTNNSRMMQPGWAFFAIRGAKFDATQLIPDMISAGASVIVTDKEYKGESFKVDNVQKFMGEVAAKFFAPLPENIIAVTGTSGKTSTVHFCRYILEQMGKNAASLGTMGLIHKGITAELDANGNTTPDAILLAKALHNLKVQGCDYIAMEASSIGLDQYRMTALPIKVAAFTNLSRDHLNVHGTMENYFESKKRLFTEVLDKDGVAVLNADDEKFADLSKIKQRVISYGKKGENIKLIDAEYSENSQKVTVGINGKIYSYEIDAPGEFQTYNSMCAIGMISGLGFDIEDIIRAISGAPTPAGRLQFVGSPVKGGGVYVDFAHTPEQLEKVLKVVRQFCKGRLMIMLGLGGGRDQGNRSVCGKVMNDLADVIYVTDGNWRMEDPDNIREQILSGCPNAIQVPGRRNGIARAIRDMKDNDILILAAKGDRQWMYIGENRYHFSDIEEAKKAMELAKLFPGKDFPL